jgi:hypothetical protein
MPNGDLLMVISYYTDTPPGYEPPTPEEEVLDRMAFLDGQTGALLEVRSLPAVDGEPWEGFGVDAEGFFVFRAPEGEGTAHIDRFDFSGQLVWSVDHTLDLDYRAALHPQGGIVVAGSSDDALVAQYIDADGANAWEETIPDEGCIPTRVRALDISPTGQIAVAGTTIPRDPDPGVVIGPSGSCLTRLDPTGTLRGSVALPGEPLGVAFVGDDKVVVWSKSVTADSPGWILNQYDADNSVTWDWQLPARDDYSANPSGHFAYLDGYLFVSGAYVGALDLGSAQVTSAGCTDDFIAQFRL